MVWSLMLHKTFSLSFYYAYVCYIDSKSVEPDKDWIIIFWLFHCFNITRSDGDDFFPFLGGSSTQVYLLASIRLCSVAIIVSVCVHGVFLRDRFQDLPSPGGLKSYECYKLYLLWRALVLEVILISNGLPVPSGDLSVVSLRIRCCKQTLPMTN